MDVRPQLTLCNALRRCGAAFRVMAKSLCPTRDELAAFSVGKLARDAFDHIAEHVAECTACEQALAAFESAAPDADIFRQDELLSFVRSSANSQAIDEVQSENLTQSWMAAAIAAIEHTQPDFAAEDDSDQTLPRRLGKFELLERVGSGSFGHVFRAQDVELERTVAVKVLRPSGFAGPEDVDRFLREARSAARLKHPGIMMLFGTGKTTDGTYFLVQEFIEGRTLEAVLGSSDEAEESSDTDKASEQPLLPRKAARWAKQIADALAYAHAAGVVHRDVKPSNIIIDAQDNPHLMDFGLAKFEADDSQMTPDGQVMGTPAYMSPEQARGDVAAVDPRSDVYSLGIVLYEMLAGRRPFRGNRRMVLLQVLQDDPESPRHWNDRIPRDLETICLKAIEKDPQRRYASAAEFAADLRRYGNGEPIKARPIGMAERLWRWCRRNPVAASLMMALTLGSALGLISMGQLSDEVIRESALENAATYSRLLEDVNTHYSSQVVDRVTNTPVDVTHDYRNQPHAIPVPATFLTELGERVSSNESGMKVRHFSDFPFRNRMRGRVLDEFEQDALVALRANPQEPFFRFENYGDQPALRYATARLMQESCVACHNSHEDSMKTDWAVGDVRGVLEIIRPLETDAERARDGLHGAFSLMGIVILVMWGASALLLVTLNTRRKRAGIAMRDPAGPEKNQAKNKPE